MNNDLIDSNLIIYAAQPGREKLHQYIADEVPLVSAISKVETLGYHDLKPNEETFIEELFNTMLILSISEQTISKAISLRQQRRMSLGDALIAGTALTPLAISFGLQPTIQAILTGLANWRYLIPLVAKDLYDLFYSSYVAFLLWQDKMSKKEHEKLIERTVTYTLQLEGSVYIVENVPARVNVETGEEFFAPETVDHLRATIRGGSQTPKRYAETPVYEYS